MCGVMQHMAEGYSGELMFELEDMAPVFFDFRDDGFRKFGHP